MKEKQICGIHRCEKRKINDVTGIMKEANRDANDPKEFRCSEIDWEKTSSNQYLKKSENFLRDIKNIIANAGINNYRRDAVVMIDSVYTAAPEFFQTHTQKEIDEFFKQCLQFHESTYGHTINAVIHYDETTPHMHVASVPIVKDSNGKNHLSAKTLMGQKNDYIKRQDAFYECVCRQFGLDRGTSAKQTKAQHKDQLDYKIEEKNKELEKLDGKILTSNQIKSQKVNKGLFGKNKENITMSYDDYVSLKKTATAVNDVFARERNLKEKEKAFDSEKEKAQKSLEIERKNIDTHIMNRVNDIQAQYIDMANFIAENNLKSEFMRYVNNLDEQFLKEKAQRKNEEYYR